MSWYVDSSVILSVIFNESEVAKLPTLFRNEFVTSDLSKIEVLRNVTKTDDTLLPQARKLLRQISFIEMSNLILERACEYTSEITVKTLDAIHLATAETLSPLIEGVITLDKQMAKNARKLHLTVY